MLDQSFSVEVLRKIYDLENRKGHYLEDKYFKELIPHTEKSKLLRDAFLLKCKVRMSNEQFRIERENFLSERRKIVAVKDELLTASLTKIGDDLGSGRFQFSLEAIKGNGKQLYKLSDDVKSFFLLKHAQYNINKLYKIKHSSRVDILKQLKAILNDKMPKYVIKTDIKEFYESLPTDRLLAKLSKDNLLSFTTKLFISKVIKEYKGLSKANDGIPRGVGISAYLAEIYLREFDKKILQMDCVTFYGRYVDDIVLVMTPGYKGHQLDVDEVIAQVFKECGLIQNKDKTVKIDHSVKLARASLDFLGYRITFGAGNVVFDLSRAKIERYKKRIDIALHAYAHLAKINEKKARKDLVKRIRYLSGNTRLTNNKSHVSVGIHCSNSLLTNSRSIMYIQKYFDQKVSSSSFSSALIQRLLKYSFLDGFEKKTFSVFKSSELKKIVSVWANEKK
jgi:hypothetical protein